MPSKACSPRRAHPTSGSDPGSWAPGSSTWCPKASVLSVTHTLMRVLGGLRFYCSDSSLLSLRTPAVLYFDFFAAVGDTRPLGRVRAVWSKGLGGLNSPPTWPWPCSLRARLSSPQLVGRVWESVRPVCVSVFHPSPLLLSSSFLNSDDEVAEPNRLQNPSWLRLWNRSPTAAPRALSASAFPSAKWR